MSSTGFAYPNLFGKKVPPPAPRWAGNAKYNFIGGHNDRSLIPIEGLIEATASVLRREGQDLALYSLAQGPQGYRGLRQFVADKLGALARHQGRRRRRADHLRLGAGDRLINQVLLEPGDTVILEEFTYGGYLTKLRRIGVNIVGAPLDEDGIRVDALGADPRRSEGKGHDAEIHLHGADDPEPDRQHHAARAAAPVPRRRGRIRRADLRGRVLRRPDLGRHGRAAGALFARSEPGHPYRLVLEDIGPGLAARLCRRRLGVHEPHGRDQERRRQRHRRARTDGRRRVFLEAFRRTMSTS